MTSSIDPRDLRNAFGKFPTGVTVVTTVEADGTPRGFTANSFTSVSLDPALLLVCIGKSAASLDVFLESKSFAVSILSEEQKETSGLFATQRADKFNVCSWHSCQSGVPILDGSLAWFDCVPEQQIDAGDHVILIGRVTDYAYHNAQPLGYLSGGYFTLGLEQSLVDVARDGNGIIIAAVLEQNGRILLEEDSETGKLMVPGVGRDGSRPGLPMLIGLFSTHGLDASIDFLFSVYEDYKTDLHVVCYRGRASGTVKADKNLAWYSLGDLPWERLIDYPTESMLRRYVDESTVGRFAVYIGDDESGTVQQLSAVR